MAPRRRLLLVLLAFAALYLIWGSTYLAMRVAIDHLPPLLMGGTRFIATGLILLVFLACTSGIRRADLRPRFWRSALLVGLGMMLFGNGFVAMSLERVPTGVAALIVATTPMWLVGLDWASGRSGRPRAQVIFGLILGLVGIAVLSGVGAAEESLRLDPWGVLGLLIATLGWACGSIYSRHAPLPHSILLATAMEMLAGGVAVLVVSSVLEPWSEIDLFALPGRAVFAWSYLVLFGSLIGFTAYLWLLREVSAAKVATYAYVNPVIAVWLGWLVLDEAIGPRTLIAGAMILIAVIIINLARVGPRDAALVEPVASIDVPVAEEQILELELQAEGVASAAPASAAPIDAADGEVAQERVSDR